MEALEVKNKVAETLAVLSSYSQSKIIDLIDYSEETNLQLVALVPSAHKDTLAFKLSEKFDQVDQQDLYDELYVSIKTVEKLIEYVFNKYD